MWPPIAATFTFSDCGKPINGGAYKTGGGSKWGSSSHPKKMAKGKRNFSHGFVRGRFHTYSVTSGVNFT
jgi:hypothetical protein